MTHPKSFDHGVQPENSERFDASNCVVCGGLVRFEPWIERWSHVDESNATHFALPTPQIRRVPLGALR